MKDIDINIKRHLTYLLNISLLIGAAILFMSNTPHKTICLLLYAVFSAMLIFHRILFEADKGRPARKYILAVLLVLASCIQYFDTTIFAGFYHFILIVYAVLLYQARFSIPFSIAAVIAYMVMLYVKSGAPAMTEFWVENRIVFVSRFLIVLIIIITSYSIEIGRQNRRLAESLQEKTTELETALTQLTIYADELKKTADLRARERIMHELHDKLGHILATASIGTQAAVVLLDQDPTAAKIRLGTVTQQIQLAMQSVRDLISGGNTYQNEEELSFTQSMIRLMDETEKRTGFVISHNLCEEAAQDYDELPLPKRSFIYNALMEGLTNGIKHGAASRFEFHLVCLDNRIHFRLGDNGKGFKDMTYGYGLSKMQREAKRFGAQFEISGHKGCILKISIPVEN